MAFLKTINLQLIPTPTIWVTTTAPTPPFLETETGKVIQTETGKSLEKNQNN